MTLLLEIARGIAALWVFFFHFKDSFSGSPVVFTLSSYGALAVPMFFVISGYVVALSAARHIAEDRSAIDFIKRRAIRIYPTFIASILVILALPLTMGFLTFLKTGSYAATACAPCSLTIAEWLSVISLTRVFIEHPGGPQEAFSIINIVYWTLAIEIQFYLVMFSSIAWKKHYNKIILTVTAVSMALTLVPNNINAGVFLHYWPQFAVGVAIAHAHQKGIVAKKYIGATGRGIMSLLLILLLVISTQLLSHQKLVFSILFGWFVWSVAEVEGHLATLKSEKRLISCVLIAPLLTLGSMSYSVYLLHTKLYGLSSMFSRQFTQDGSFVRAISTIIITLGFCYVFFYFVERRFIPQRLFTRTSGSTRASPPEQHRN